MNGGSKSNLCHHFAVRKPDSFKDFNNHPSIEKLTSGWVASHAEVNLAKRYLEVTLTNIFQDIDMLPTVNYNVNALPMRRIGQR